VRGHERGGVATELAVVTPALVVLVLFVVFAGRIAQAHHDVMQAAAEGARDASLTRTGDADATVRATVERNLAAAGVGCRDLAVVVTGGPSVRVDVRCDVDLTGVATLGLPGHRTVTASADEVVDVYRGATPDAW
jgi:Flp pilus assembly protein TadG